MSTQVSGKIVRKLIISDIRSGMHDGELLDKHGLSDDQKWALCPIPRILTGDIVSDIRSGVRDPDPTQKYGVSYRRLRKVFMEPADVGAVGPQEITGKRMECGDEPDGSRTPRFLRNHLPYPVRICVARASEPKGLLLDISETGASLAGIEAQVDETKTFCVMANHNTRIASFVFEAKCRWIRMEDDAEHIAGYSIENMPDHDSWQLRNFIQALGHIRREPTQSEYGSQEGLSLFS